MNNNEKNVNTNKNTIIYAIQIIYVNIKINQWCYVDTPSSCVIP